MDEKNLRDELERKAMNLLEKSESIEAGTDKHSKIVEDVCRLCKAYDENYKTEFDVYYQNLRTDSEVKRNEEEAEIKKLQIELDKRKHDRVKADNIFMMIGFGVLTAGACVYEVRGGHIIPGKILQFANYIPKAIKV